MFQNPFSFEGRIRRTEFGITFILYCIASVLLNVFVESAPFIVFVVAIPLIWFCLAQGAKRCHDLGNSGWYQLIPFYVLWLIFANSVPGTNEYGPNPKGE